MLEHAAGLRAVAVVAEDGVEDLRGRQIRVQLDAHDGHEGRARVLELELEAVGDAPLDLRLEAVDGAFEAIGRWGVGRLPAGRSPGASGPAEGV